MAGPPTDPGRPEERPSERPEQQPHALTDQQVADLLAGLKVTEPLPESVGYRLDRTLDTLIAESPMHLREQSEQLPGLPRRFNRHLGRRLLGAAAAVAVVALVATPFLRHDDTSSNSAAVKGGSVEQGAASAPDAPSAVPPPQQRSSPPPIRLHKATLAQDVRRNYAALTGPTGSPIPTPSGCASPDAGQDVSGRTQLTAPVLLDGSPALLDVSRSKGAAASTASAYSCADGSLVARVDLKGLSGGDSGLNSPGPGPEK